MNEMPGVTLEITKRCQFACKFCFSASNHTGTVEPPLTKSMIDRVISELISVKCKKVIVTGGEPLMDISNLVYLLKKLNEARIVVNLNSNLGLMTERKMKCLSSLLDPDIYIFSSILSPIREKCDAITCQPGSFDSIVRGIKICKNYGFRISINTTISKENADCLDFLSIFVKDHGIDRLSISPVIPPFYDRDNVNYSLDSGYLQKIADTLLDIHHSLEIPVCSNTPLPLCMLNRSVDYTPIESSHCDAGTESIAIDMHNGIIYVCSQEEIIYGNVYFEHLKDIVPKIKNEHKDLNLHPTCINCYLLDSCKGQCKWTSCTICGVD